MIYDLKKKSTNEELYGPAYDPLQRRVTDCAVRDSIVAATYKLKYNRFLFI